LDKRYVFNRLDFCLLLIGTQTVRKTWLIDIEQECWHDSCGADTTIVTGLDLVFGPYRREFSVSDFTGYSELFDFISSRIPSHLV
jgi:hypothetical protein